MRQRAVGHINYVMAASAPEADRAIRSNRELRDRAISPEVRAVWHADHRTHIRLGEMADARELLAHDVRLPPKLRGVGKELPLETAGHAKLRIRRRDAVGRGAQDLDNLGARKTLVFPRDTRPHQFVGQPACDEDSAPLIASKSVATGGEVRQFERDETSIVWLGEKVGWRLKWISAGRVRIIVWSQHACVVPRLRMARRSAGIVAHAR